MEGGEEGGEVEGEGGEQGEREVGEGGEVGERDMGEEDEELEEEDDVLEEEEEETDGMWEEKFKTHADSKPYGELSVNLYVLVMVEWYRCVCVCVCVCVIRTQCGCHGYLLSGGGACVWNSGTCRQLLTQAYQVSHTHARTRAHTHTHTDTHTVMESPTVYTISMCLNMNSTIEWLSMAPSHSCWPTSESVQRERESVCV